ncbi:MAG: hypothetical protein ACFFCS_27650, partial [Candidatus Hodarchaeota archaeon]
ESKGGVMEHILIAREYILAIHRGHPNAKPGPFEEDTRILFEKDIDDIREMFNNAHKQGLVKYNNYNLIQMVEHPSFFSEDKRFQPIMDKVEGIAYECHQFNRHWPLETGWSQPKKVVKGAQWTFDQDKEYIFYYGPIIWIGPRDNYSLKSKRWRTEKKKYYKFIERDWLKTYWKTGLPKYHPRMHYYLNTFPHGIGRGRPVGPETDPHSILGFTKWLIEEIKMGGNQKQRL